MSEIAARLIAITPAEMAAVVTQHPNVIIDVWGENCAPCKALRGLLLNDAIPELLVYECFSLKADNHTDWVKMHHIRQLPTLFLYQDGELVNRQSGIISAGQLQLFLNQNRDTRDDLRLFLESELAAGKLDNVEQALAAMNERERRHPEFARIQSHLHLLNTPLPHPDNELVSRVMQALREADWAWLANTLADVIATQAKQADALLHKDVAESLHDTKHWFIAMINAMPDRSKAQQWRRWLSSFSNME
ncbi:MAG: thioredoxin domain-containing protein [Oleibacter sp.]|nr:thioredoxin domain-containing protein [Thalassolituus sp.]